MVFPKTFKKNFNINAFVSLLENAIRYSHGNEIRVGDRCNKLKWFRKEISLPSAWAG